MDPAKAFHFGQSDGFHKSLQVGIYRSNAQLHEASKVERARGEIDWKVSIQNEWTTWSKHVLSPGSRFTAEPDQKDSETEKRNTNLQESRCSRTCVNLRTVVSSILVWWLIELRFENRVKCLRSISFFASWSFWARSMSDDDKLKTSESKKPNCLPLFSSFASCNACSYHRFSYSRPRIYTVNPK